MGLFWKEVIYAPYGGIFVVGRRRSWSKGYFLWRFQNPWRIFKVETEMDYWVYFSDSNVNMRFRKKISTPYFAARIGREDVTFTTINSRRNYRSESLKIISYPKLFNWLEIRKPKIILEGGIIISSRQITLI